jgi:AbrB family looped-hinge helix DNA binding protein
MSKVTLSPEFQVIIPEDARIAAGLHAGISLEVISYGNRIELIPVSSIKSLKGYLKGIDTRIERDQDRL